ncbi:MAG: glycine rich protein [Bacteriophage sp.]|nr:MAG: glycine rich protein [Bacteriophage sp.]
MAMSNIKTGDILNFDYTGTVQTVTLPKGTYKLECWGAQGGYSSSNSGIEVGMGGKGGYSAGTITLNQKTLIYIYTGGVGSISGNGKADGGFPNGGSSWASSTSEGAGGGGGSSDIRIGTDSLYARVIVAGGGGGGGEDNETGGYGGGETGGTSGSGTPGSQTAPSGYFGIGGHTSYDGGGGGGGWYGAYPAGGQTTPATGSSGSDTSGSPGGSGYVYTSATASNYPSGCLLNSSYYLSAAKTIAGNTSFTSPTGSSETGHSGNGYCRITVIECSNTALYVRINNSMKKATAFYFKLNNNKMYGVGSANYNGSVMNFDYTGSVQTATLTPGTYKLECWGAQGGTYSGYIGGYGGYSKGTITLTKTTTVYISVGGAGSSSSTAAGFNGGGTGISSGRGGGGATDVRIGQNSLYSRVIVAGGGGGAGVTSANANPCGCGGGEYGGDGYYNDTTGSYTAGQNRSGGSASQTAGGITWSTGTQATFGQGGNASGYSCGGGGGGWYGGGGAYDSDSDSDGRWGGGGSGYVYTSSTAKNYPNGCLLNSTHYLTNAQTIAGNTSFTSPTGSAETGHTGSGFCRITNLNPTQYGLYVKTNSGWKHIDL